MPPQSVILDMKSGSTGGRRDVNCSVRGGGGVGDGDENDEVEK